MNFWERIKSWLSGRQAVLTKPEAPNPAGTSLGKTKPFIISKDMLNTITLSTDLSKLYLIDNGKLVTFSLDTPNGLTIGLLEGQLAVVTKQDPPSGSSGPVAGPTVEDEGALISVGSRTAAAKKKDLRFELEERNQYSVTFNSANQAMGIIGATDIISTITVPDNPPTEGPEGQCTLHLFDLSTQNVTLKKMDGVLLVSAKDK